MQYNMFTVVVNSPCIQVHFFSFRQLMNMYDLQLESGEVCVGIR